MGKDVVIEVPTVNMVISAKEVGLPENMIGKKFSMILVPQEALAEIQELLKKYQ